MKKVILIGDSIREGYDKYVKMALEGEAEVLYPKENCRFTSYIMRNLIVWQRDLGWGNDADLLHWNAGLWDDLIMLDGKHHTPLPIYRENVERLCNIFRICFPNAKMIFATSTPVIAEEARLWSCPRYNEDTEKYNEAASEIVRRYGGEINDLYALASTFPNSYHSDTTHYYTKEGTAALSDRVSSVIADALGIKAKKLDYDALFAEKTNIVGH